MYRCIFSLECKCVFRIWDLLLLLLLFFCLLHCSSFHIDTVNVWVRVVLHVTCISFLLQFKCLNGFSNTRWRYQYLVFRFYFVWFGFVALSLKDVACGKTIAKERKKNRCSAFATIYSSEWSMMRAREKEFDIEQILILYWHIFSANSEMPCKRNQQTDKQTNRQTSFTTKSRHTVAPAWHIPALIQSLLPFFSYFFLTSILLRWCVTCEIVLTWC